MIKIREYVKVKDLEEAYQLNQKKIILCFRGNDMAENGISECGDGYRSVRTGTGLY